MLLSWVIFIFTLSRQVTYCNIKDFDLPRTVLCMYYWRRIILQKFLEIESCEEIFLVLIVVSESQIHFSINRHYYIAITCLQRVKLNLTFHWNLSLGISLSKFFFWNQTEFVEFFIIIWLIDGAERKTFKEEEADSKGLWVWRRNWYGLWLWWEWWRNRRSKLMFIIGRIRDNESSLCNIANFVLWKANFAFSCFPQYSTV